MTLLTQGTAASIWDLKRSLAEELLDLRRQSRESSVFVAAVQDYTDCVSNFGLSGITSPAELDDMRGTKFETSAAKAAGACDGFWRAVNDNALNALSASFLEKHKDVIDRQRATYSGALVALRQDKGFAAFLAGEMARIEHG
jgi:hypothetical protein